MIRSSADKPLRIAIAGGGTSGHVNPALAIAQSLRQLRPDIEIIFVGSSEGIEHDLVPRAGFEFVPVPAYPFENTPRDIVKALIALAKGTRACKQLIRERDIAAVIGTGGYVASPLLSAAKKMQLPCLIHEQNAYPGRSNRVMSRGADVVCISYEKSASYFNKAQRVVLTGNPIDEKFFSIKKTEARRALGIDEREMLILATGGSMGARSINRAVIELAEIYREKQLKNPKQQASSLRILLVSGKTLYEECLKQLESSGLLGYEGLKIENYLYNMVSYMAAADIVISRAGAIACAEIAALGKAAILVPFPFATGDHQRHNALAFVEREAGLCIDDHQLNGQSLFQAINEIKERPERLGEMERAAATLASPTAATDICTEFIALLPKVVTPKDTTPEASLEENG